MDATAIWIEHLCATASGPISFTVLVPHWTDPPTHFIPAMQKVKQSEGRGLDMFRSTVADLAWFSPLVPLQSRFTRQQFIIPAYQHRYIAGQQHTLSADPRDRYFKARYPLVLYAVVIFPSRLCL